MARDYLEKCIQDKQLATSYLFAGKKGLGKEALALDFIKLLFPQGHHKIDQGNHPDVKLIGDDREERSIKIEAIRDVQSWLRLKAFEAPYKVAVILDAERMTVQAQNAFLKTLEEPPANSIVVLTSQSPLQLIPTILSRVQEVRLKPLPKEELTRELKEVGEAVSFVSYYAGGSLDEASAMNESGILDVREELFGLFFHYDLNEFFNLYDKKAKSKGSAFVRESIDLLRGLFRDLLLCQCDKGESKYLINADYESQVRDYASRCSRDQILEGEKRLEELSYYIESNVNPKLAASSIGVILNHG